MGVHPTQGRCRGRVLENHDHCFDHSCPCCGFLKIPRQACCNKCSSAGKIVPPCQLQLQDAFVCELSQPLPLTSAYHQLTGMWPLFTCDFRPTTGEPWKHGWGEMKDHIFSSSDLAPIWILPPPDP